MFSFTHNGKIYFCNNEDAHLTDSEVRFYPSEEGKYAWVYLGFSNDWAQGGVNEKGLCWDWFAGFTVEGWYEDSTMISINGNPSETMITQCATVDETIEFYEKHNEPGFSYGRIMVTDKSGNCAIIGWKDGKMSVTRKDKALLALGYRENIIRSYFANIQGATDLRYMADALSAAHQNGTYSTRYSNIFCLDEGKIILYNYRNFDEFIEIDYAAKLKNGFAKYTISELFDEKSKIQDVILVKNDSLSDFGIDKQNYSTDNYAGYYYTGDRFFLIIEQHDQYIVTHANDYSNYVSSDTLYITSNDIYENTHSLFKFSDRSDNMYNKVLAVWYADAYTYQRATFKLNTELAKNFIGKYLLSDNSIAAISFSDDELSIIMSNNKDGVVSEFHAKAIDNKNLIYLYGRIAFDDMVDSKFQQINFVSNMRLLKGERIK